MTRASISMIAVVTVVRDCTGGTRPRYTRLTSTSTTFTANFLCDRHIHDSRGRTKFGSFLIINDQRLVIVSCHKMPLRALGRTGPTSGQVVIDLQTATKELVENALDAGATNIGLYFLCRSTPYI